MEVSVIMTMKKMMKRHKDKFIICIPKLRDASTNRPLTFSVLQTCCHAPEACKILDSYEKQGGLFENVIAIPNFTDEGNYIPPELPPNRYAKMFRVLYGMQ